MKIKAMGSSLAIALALGACGGSGDIDEFVKLDTSKGEAFAVGGEDCDAKADSVRKWRTENNQRYKELRKSLSEKYKKGPPEKYKEQLSKNKQAVMSAMMNCANNEAFGKAIDETE